MEFFEPSEARKAFMRLAYSKFKHLPLYLEWAPDDSFTTAPSKAPKVKSEKDTLDEASEKGTKGKNAGKNETEEKHADEKKDSKKDDDDEDEDEPEPETTLFVKNLNFSTDEEQLKKVHYLYKNSRSYWKLGEDVLFWNFMFYSFFQDAAHCITRISP